MYGRVWDTKYAPNRWNKNQTTCKNSANVDSLTAQQLVPNSRSELVEVRAPARIW